MMLKSIISSKLLLFGSLFVVGVGCSNKAVKASKDTPKENETVEESSKASDKELIVTFKNERVNLSYRINPNDEDLYINLSAGEVKGVEPSRSEPTPNPQPISINQTMQSPQPVAAAKVAEPEESKYNHQDDMIEDLKRQLKEKSEEDKKVGLPPEDATDRVLSDIRKAQEALYNNELGRAEKLVRNSLGIKETAEGFSLLGSIHYMRKDKPRALDAWKRSLELDPNNQDVREMIFQVEKQGK